MSYFDPDHTYHGKAAPYNSTYHMPIWLGLVTVLFLLYVAIRVWWKIEKAKRKKEDEEHLPHRKPYILVIDGFIFLLAIVFVLALFLL